MSAPKLLLVDDDEGGRMVLAALLEDAGYQVREAGTLAEARLALEEGPWDVALLDVQLPDGRGPSLVGALRARGPKMVIAILSGHDTVESDPVDLHLVKGGPSAQLLDKLRGAVASRESTR